MTKPAEPPADDEQGLVERAVDGDVPAFEQLYRRYVGRIHGLCIRMTGDADAAEDCTQETFVQAWYKLDSFEGRSRLSTWLHRIAVNAVLGRRRKERDWLRREPELADLPAEDRSPGTRIDLEGAIRALPAGARDVFVLRGVYGYSHEEAADMLGVAVGTSKAQLHRARRLLKEWLEDGSPEKAPE